MNSNKSKTESKFVKYSLIGISAVFLFVMLVLPLFVVVTEALKKERYDIVAANILADVLVPLTPVIVHQMKKGAYYITSGILDVKEEVVKEAVLAAGLTLVEVTHQGEWVCVTARKD